MLIVAHNASPVVGGGEIWLERLLNGLRTRGHQCIAACGSNAVADMMRGTGIEASLVRLGGDAMLTDAVAFARILRKAEPDALLITTFKKMWLGGMAGRLAKIPRIIARTAVSSHRARNFTYTIPIRHFVDVVVANASGVRDPLLESIGTIDPARIITIYDGVPPQVPRITREAYRATLGISASAAVIGSVGRLVPQKRYDRLLHAFARLPPDSHLIVSGEGPQRPALERLSAELGVTSRAHFPGFASCPADALNALDVFVLSSDFEGLSNAMLEAMALGIPVVTTPVSGALDSMESFPDGTRPGVTAAPNPESLSQEIMHLLNDPQLRKKTGAAGSRRVAQRFAFERMLDEWEKLCLPR
ncbi:MAG: glycosyltransferase [Gemmatimonadaceae bacterium]|nr:glycosyltransferase [Gemmatimonadaceae bacterium]MDQ3242585.1 glycosyltransferase [Gemmatimonadota bacterium]